MSLLELSLRDKDWRKMAYTICGCKSLADDLVQDMYLKFHNYNKELNDFYIFFAIRSLFLDTLKKKRLDISDVDIANVFIIDNDYSFEDDFFKEDVLKKVNELPYFERELLLVTQVISQRELSRQTDISIHTIKKTIKETKIQLWEDLKK